MYSINTYTLIVCLAWALAAAGLAWYCATVARQITYVTLADGRRQERRIPLGFRLLLPLAPNLAPLFARPGFARARRSTRRRIVSAGFEGLLHAEEILALQVLMPLLYGALWAFFVFMAGEK